MPEVVREAFRIMAGLGLAVSGWELLGWTVRSALCWMRHPTLAPRLLDPTAVIWSLVAAFLAVEALYVIVNLILRRKVSRLHVVAATVAAAATLAVVLEGTCCLMAIL